MLNLVSTFISQVVSDFFKSKNSNENEQIFNNEEEQLFQKPQPIKRNRKKMDDSDEDDDGSGEPKDEDAEADEGFDIDATEDVQMSQASTRNSQRIQAKKQSNNIKTRSTIAANSSSMTAYLLRQLIMDINNNVKVIFQW